ncbi:MAG: hypothetical protein QF600_00520 [Verrucomicrobiota bacterium]|jgi:hypothetical protein|nr:hypothetical protein [Verrucomicrobiota bacterium]
MKKQLIILLAITSFTVSLDAESEFPIVKTSDAFKQLQGVIGKWKGKFTRGDGTVVNCESEFSLISNGSAIVERSVNDGTEMLTMYHDKNGQLTVTHYCAFGNAPSFTLSKKDKHTFSFAFDSTCGLKAGKDKFVNSWVINYDPKKPDNLQTYFKLIDTDKSVVGSSAKLTRVK